jgi:Ni/Co efflux regulator RcnB
MMKNSVRTITRAAILSVAAAIAVSAWTIAGPPSFAASPSTTYAKRYDWSTNQPGHQPPHLQSQKADLDLQAFQWNRTSPRRYHQSYQRPHGWYPVHWVYGQVIPSLFWTQAYWLTGYNKYGLIDPPYGYVWVQNANDALLVNFRTGEILSVEYNVFYA